MVPGLAASDAEPAVLETWRPIPVDFGVAVSQGVIGPSAPRAVTGVLTEKLDRD